MRHAILGVGGVGGLIGACLSRIGEAVTLVVRPETLSRYPSKLQLESSLGNWEGYVEWSASVPPADVLWLTVKATQLTGALQSIPESRSAGAIVPLLNGIDHVQTLRSRFGNDRVIPATIAGETERVGIGHIVHRSPFAVLNMSARGRELLAPMSEQLRAIGFICNFIEDETTLLWSKLVFLGPFALTTSAFDNPIGEILVDPQKSRQLEASVREACAAGVAEGAKLDVEAILKLVRKAPPSMRSSMQKDVDQGRAPELDAIGGAIVRAAHRHGLQAVLAEELMARIEARVKQQSS
jgi:2-dehydropantoate 2-reductase